MAMTIAQALASSETGILVVDTPTNIARAASNAGLVARVTQFTMSANAASSPQDATLLAGLGAKFSVGAFRLTVRGTLAELDNAAYAAGVDLGMVVAVLDTAANLLASPGSPALARASSVVMSSNASVTLANLVTLEAMTSFSVYPGATITLADSAANLLGITQAQKRAALRVYQLAVDATVSVETADQLRALPQFSIAAGTTLTVSGTAAQILASPSLALLPGLAAISGVAVQVADTLSNLLAQRTTLTALVATVPGLATRMTDSPVLTVSDAVQVPNLPGFAAASGQVLTITDTVANLLFMGAPIRAVVNATHLAQSTTVTVAQAGGLASLPGFTPGTGITLTVADTIANMATISNAARAVASALVIEDTVAALLAAATLPANVPTIHATVDGGTYTVADIAALLAKIGNQVSFTLVGTQQNGALHIADTLIHLVAGEATLDALRSHGTVSVTATDTGGVVTAATAATLAGTSGFDPAAFAISVADSGSALSAVASAIFGHGFPSITVTSGVFTASAAQLNDPTLHFTGAATARLGTSATVSLQDVMKLEGLPGFGVGNGVSLTVSDTIAHLVTTAGAPPAGVTDIAVTNGGPVSVAQIAILAALRASVGAGHFSLGSNVLTIVDTAAALTSPPATGAVGLASAISLAANAMITVDQALTLAQLPVTLSLAGSTVTIVDSITHLVSLSTSASLAIVNAWQPVISATGDGTVSLSELASLTNLANFSRGSFHLTLTGTAAALAAHAQAADLALIDGARLSADATVTIAQAQALSTLPAFSHGTHVLTVADTAVNILHITGNGSAPDNWVGALVADRVILTADAAIDAAGAAQLAQLGSRFDRDGHALTIVDTPTELADMASGSGLSGQVTSFQLAHQNLPWTMNAASASALAHLPGFDAGPGIIVVDSVGNLLAPNALDGLAIAQSVTLPGATAVNAQTAIALHVLPHFSAGIQAVTIADTGAQLATLDNGTAGMATSIVLSAAGVVTVQTFNTIVALPNFDTAGQTLLVGDTAANLLTLVGQDISQASGFLLRADASVTAANATLLAGLPHFSTNGALISITDTADHLTHITGGPLPDNWAGVLLASTVSLSADAVVTAAQGTLLARLGTHFSLNGHALTIQDTPTALLDPANMAGLGLAASVTLTTAPVTITASDATRLQMIAGFSTGGAVVTVSDTAANLAFTGFAPGISLADHLQLSAAATLTVAEAATLVGHAGFQVNGAAALTIADSLAHLLSLSSISLAPNNTILQSTAIALSEDTTATVAQLTALRNLAQYNLAGHPFSLGGSDLVVLDSGRRIANFTPDSVVTPAAYVMTGDAIVSAAQATILATRNVDPSGNLITIADTAAHLLDAGNQAGIAIADTLILSANATVDAADATTLFGNARFNAGGHLLTVQDSAAALLGLSTDTKLMATILQLAADETITVASLKSLSGLGIKFSTNTHAVTVADTAAHLATLHDQELALATAERLSTNAVVNAATAETLVSLPNFVRGAGVTLAVEDTVAHLIDLSNAVRSVATTERLASGAVVTVTAAEAAALAGLPHFDVGDAQITVRDTIAHLNAAQNSSWHAIAAAHQIVDSIANIAAAAATSLVTDASAVVPTGDSTIDAATAGILADITAFNHGDQIVIVVDGPQEIVAHVSDILAIATGARVNLSTPVTAAQAQALAPLGSANMLSFSAGQHLTIDDTYAHLTDNANASGLALGTSITVRDAVANILTAATHDWGSVVPSYVMTADGTVNATQVGHLSALGGHFTRNGFVLTVQDSATAIIAADGDIHALGGIAIVSDTIQHLGAQTTGLLALVSPVTIVVTDAGAVTAARAAALDPILALLASGTQVAVTDTAVSIAAVATTLHDLGNVLAQLTLTGGTTMTAATAVALTDIQGHLANGVGFDVSDTAASIVGHQGGLAALATAGRINTIAAPDQTAALVVTYGAALGVLNATATILDSAANLATRLDALAPYAGVNGVVQGITLTDGTPPTISVSVTQLHDDASVLALIGSTSHLQVSDTAAHIRADLVSNTSAILAGLSGITAIVADDNGTITLTPAQIQAAHVDDGASSALAKFSGGDIAVAGATVADLAGLASLGVVPDSIAISDTAAHIQADLAGGTPALVTHRALIGQLAVSDAGTIALTTAQILTAHVDDGAGSALSTLTGGTVAVTDATVADIDALVALPVAPGHMTIVDTAAHVRADLIAGASDILSNLGSIDAISLVPSGTITLTATQAARAGLDDGAASALAKMTGVTLVVTDVAVADIGATLTLEVPPASITVQDTAAHVQADLISNTSALLANRASITAITVSPGASITLTATQALAAHVDDGAGSVFSKVSGASLIVSGATIAELPDLVGLGVPPSSIAISDTAAHIQAALAAGIGSDLLVNLASVSVITNSDAGTISLTPAQIAVAGVDDGAGSALAKLTGGTISITDAAIADIAAIAGLPVVPDSILVSDTAAHIIADLAAGNASVILANAARIAAIDDADAGVIQLTVSQALHAGVADDASSAMAKLSGGVLRVTGAAVADLDALAGLYVPPATITIVDTAAHIAADIAAGNASDLLAARTSITAITDSDSNPITLTASQVLTAHVDDGAGSVMSKITGGSLVVTGATVVNLASIAALAVPPASISMTDTAAHIAADLAAGDASVILGNLGLITGIANADTGTITLTAAQILHANIDDGTGSALSLLNSGQIVVTDVAVADIATIIALDVPPGSIVVRDTAAHIQADLAAGNASVILAHLATTTDIQISDSGTITLSLSALQHAGIDDGAGSVAAKLSGGHLNVSGLAVSDLDTVTALPILPDHLSVSDTAAHLQADLAAGNASDLLASRTRITDIVNSNAGTITLTAAQVLVAHVNDGAGSVMSLITGGSLVVSGVATADIGAIAGLSVPPASFSVNDTAAHIASDLAAGGASGILSQLSSITAITNSNAGAITLTAAQVLATHVDDGAGSALSKVAGGSLVITGATIADLPALAALPIPPTQVSVTDTAAHVSADLALGGSSLLIGSLGLVSAITVSPAGTITLTASQVQASDVDDGAGSALSLMTGGTLVVTGVPIASIGTIVGLAVAPASITVLDSTANILADLSGAAVIAANHAHISAVRPTESTMSLADATTIFNALSGQTTFDESGLTLGGTSGALLTANASLPSMLSSAGHVTMSNNPTGLTAAQATTLSGILGGTLANGQTLQVIDTAAHLLDPANAVGIALATDVQPNTGILAAAGTVGSLLALHAFNAAAQTIWVQDSPANMLDAANASALAAASRVILSANAVVTASQLTALSGIAHFETNGHTLVPQDTAANIAALSQGALGFATSVKVVDTSADVSANLNALRTTVTDHSHALTVTLSDGVANTPTVTVTAATYAADSAVVDAIDTAGAVQVIGTASQVAALASALASSSAVGTVAVLDTAANILSNLTTLNTIGSKFTQAQITDTSINATEASGLFTVPNLVANSLTIADTGSQLAAAVVAGGADAIAFMLNHTVQLSADSIVTAGEALTLQSLTNLAKNGHTLKVWDTASHLIDSIDGYLQAVSAANIDGVYLKTTTGTATVSPATASTLFSIANFSKNNPVSGTNALVVQGTAANIESNFTALSTHLAQMTAVVVSASSTVTDAVYGHLLTLGATAGGGVTLTVRDTAANIIANAPTQLAGTPSITPTTWALSGSASVNAANAAMLGGLSGFSAGAFILTLSADAASLSVADANRIGTLGGSFSLGGHKVHVLGSVSTLSGLSGNARQIATPDITDTFAQIATLTTGDNLHGGTMTITDSATVTVAQANAFLSLLKVGNAAGIPVANVTFDSNVESVTDTLANIQTLTGSAGWTSNAAVHDDFHLVVADTVATLISGANTAALAAMNGTTLSSDQTTTAANAQSLYALQNTIHFSMGGRILTIQDTPTHLLDPGNAGGVGIADVWQLSANAVVSTADAESLLAVSKFHLNHVLTISDSSDNLLDGVLSSLVDASPYAASIHISLASNETLDARTAARIVALTGFTDNGHLSIADGSAYLLTTDSLAAENIATSVTLAGDETVSAATASKLAALPHFSLGSNTISLAANDYADAATLTAIANFDAGFDVNGKTLRMTQDALALTPVQYEALQDDNINLNGHALSALATGVSVSSAAGTVHITGNGVDGATLVVYAGSGAQLSSTAGVTASFDASASTGSIGNGMVVTEIVGGSAATSESAPIIALERAVLTTEAANDGATFAGSGQIQVDTGKFVNLYTAGSAPAHPTSPVLVYDPNAHTVSMAVEGHTPLVLVTLGAATTPASLDPSEILIRHFS